MRIRLRNRIRMMTAEGECTLDGEIEFEWIYCVRKRVPASEFTLIDSLKLLTLFSKTGSSQGLLNWDPNLFAKLSGAWHEFSTCLLDMVCTNQQNKAEPTSSPCAFHVRALKASPSFSWYRLLWLIKIVSKFLDPFFLLIPGTMASYNGPRHWIIDGRKSFKQFFKIAGIPTDCQTWW